MFNAGAASGLGHGLGCALGAKLAARDRLVIGTHGDGSYMFGNPISAHYVGAEQELPVLTVLFNNQRWQAVRRATVDIDQGWLRRQEPKAADHVLRQHLELPKSGGSRRRLRRESHRVRAK